MTDHFTIARFQKLRAIIKALGQWLKTERREKALANFHHADFVNALGFQQFANVIADLASARRGNEVVNVAPFLRPHIAEQVGADRAGFGLHLVPIFSIQLSADKGVQLIIKWLNL
jgi:dissimilatory sulfite reductase (desulfoviridin) alpha/beta subunit